MQGVAFIENQVWVWVWVWVEFELSQVVLKIKNTIIMLRSWNIKLNLPFLYFFIFIHLCFLSFQDGNIGTNFLLRRFKTNISPSRGRAYTLSYGWYLDRPKIIVTLVLAQGKSDKYLSSPERSFLLNCESLNLRCI